MLKLLIFFISKIDYIFGIQSKQIYDIQGLQNKFVEIENLIQNILKSNFKKSTNIKIEENNHKFFFFHLKINYIFWRSKVYLDKNSFLFELYD